MKDAGWLYRAEVIWHIPDRTPESATDRPCRDHEHVFMFVKQPNYWFDADAVKEPAKSSKDRRRGKRELYHGKYDGDSGFGQQSFASIRKDGYRSLRTVWSIPKEHYRDEHYAPWPKELCRRMILAGCPEGGTVLDPFAGTGTTGLVALALGRNAVLIETNVSYAAMAQQRIDRELAEYKQQCRGSRGVGAEGRCWRETIAPEPQIRSFKARRNSSRN